HIPMALHLLGELDVAALERSFNALIARHQSLRTTFQLIDERAVQVVAGAQLVRLGMRDAETGEPSEIKAFIAETTAQLFDLENGPLLRAELLRLSEHEHVLVMAQHHIVSD